MDGYGPITIYIKTTTLDADPADRIHFYNTFTYQQLRLDCQPIMTNIVQTHIAEPYVSGGTGVLMEFVRYF
jgi:hypothetical protein